jgi:DNA-directed RNA polymerase specialized sigma24 family protein
MLGATILGSLILIFGLIGASVPEPMSRRHAPIARSYREHFYSLSARIMRRVLMDHARDRKRQKRDGGVRVPLDENLGRYAEALPHARIADELLANTAFSAGAKEITAVAHQVLLDAEAHVRESR